MKEVVRNRQQLLRWVDRVAPEVEASQKPWTVMIKRFHRPRTLDQNAKFHAMVNDIAEHVGHTPTEIKAFVQAEFGFTKSISIRGKVHEVPLGTSEMNVEQLSYMIEQLNKLAADVGCRFQEG